METFCIITVEPNELCAKVHDRMPLILCEEDFPAWLDTQTSPEQLQTLLKPYRASDMESFPVSKLVNNARNESEQCIAPVATQAELLPAGTLL